MDLKDEKIIVIGAGVSGITTAVTLQLLGYETEIYTDQTIDQIEDKNAHPDFASLFPSASVIPHSVYSSKLEELFQLSQGTFYELRKLSFPGLTIHKHFEVFEFEQALPKYSNWMINFQKIDQMASSDIPCRADSQELNGWMFHCLYADWPLYFPALIQIYQNLNGQITHQKVERNEIKNLPAEIVINCSGTSSPQLFDDPIENQLVLRGHLLHQPNAPLITNDNGEIISYNYTPQASVYSDANDEACDVYCYPRKDGWILGGSRQVGSLQDGEWNIVSNDNCYKIDGIKCPRQIIDLNNEILLHTFDLSLKDTAELTSLVGYRYVRSKNDGLRLDHETFSSKKVFHNYGHGGAGVSLSWGCALEIAAQISTEDSALLQKIIIEEIENLRVAYDLTDTTV